jgi:RNA polymerase sigma-70 factor (ECF subfamily)
VAGSFEGRSQVRTWIFGIAYRKVIDAHRKRGRVDLTEDVPETGEMAESAETGFAAAQEAGHLRFCLDRLSDDHRTAISLAFYEDMTCAQIAEVVGVPEGTIKSRLFHARKLLQHCLEGRMGRRAVA